MLSSRSRTPGFQLVGKPPSNFSRLARIISDFPQSATGLGCQLGQIPSIASDSLWAIEAVVREQDNIASNVRSLCQSRQTAPPDSTPVVVAFREDNYRLCPWPVVELFECALHCIEKKQGLIVLGGLCPQ